MSCLIAPAAQARRARFFVGMSLHPSLRGLIRHPMLQMPAPSLRQAAKRPVQRKRLHLPRGGEGVHRHQRGAEHEKRRRQRTHVGLRKRRHRVEVLAVRDGAREPKEPFPFQGRRVHFDRLTGIMGPALIAKERASTLTEVANKTGHFWRNSGKRPHWRCRNGENVFLFAF